MKKNSRRALVIIDMQNDFVTGSLANNEAQKIVKSISDYVENFDGDIFATHDTHGATYLNTQEGKNLPVAHCVKGTEGWNIVPEIQEAINKKENSYDCNVRHINKYAFGYSHWNLLAYDEIEVIGTCTDICVVSNVLIIKSMYPELRIKVLSNMCAGLTEEKHLAALEVMRSCQVEVV